MVIPFISIVEIRSSRLSEPLTPWPPLHFTGNPVAKLNHLPRISIYPFSFFIQFVI